MRRSVSRRWLWLLFSVLLLIPLHSAEAKKKIEWVGQEAPFFTLPSSQDRLVDYATDYYGKYHLIMTFLPAAFTPV